MKRILTLFLALCLSVSCLALPAYGEEVAGEEQAQPKIELGIRMSEIDVLLKTLGILDSSFDLTEPSDVTLAEFAEGAARLMKLSYNADTPAFSDSADYAGINCIAGAGYIDADPNIVCMPTAAITTLDAVKILLKALGCGSLVDYYENDPSTVLAFAKRIELIESADMQAKLSRVDMAELLYNALVAEFDSTTIVVGDVTIDFAYTSLMTGMYNIHEIRGTVTANEYISIYEDLEKTGEGRLRIDDKEYNMGIPVSGDYIGRYVTAYVRTVQGSETVVAVVTDLGIDKCVEISGENIEKAEVGKIQYYPSADSKKLLTVNYTNPIFIYNGVAYVDDEHVASPAMITTTIEKAASTKRGTVKIITGGDRDVVIVDIVDNAIISSIDQTKQLVYVKLVGKDETVGISLKKTTDAVQGWTKPVVYAKATMADGVTPAVITDMVIGRLVSLVVSEDGSVVRLIFNNTVVSGTVTAAETKGGDKFVTISDAKYEVDVDYREVVDLKPGDDSIFLIDVFGRVAGTSKAIVNGSAKPGIICDTEPQGGIVKKYFVKIFKNDDTFSIFTLDDKVDFDGDRISKDVAYTRITNLLAAEDVDERRLILYKTDKDGNINYIDTTTLGENENPEETLRMVGDGEKQRNFRRASSEMLARGWASFAKPADEIEEEGSVAYYPAFDDTVMFQVPREESGALGADEDTIWEAKLGSANYDMTLRNVCIYKCGNSNPFIEYSVNYKVPAIGYANPTSNPYIVNNVMMGLDNEGNPVAVVEDARTYLITTAQHKVADQVYLYANGCRMLIKGTDIGKYIGPGDMVAFSGSTSVGTSSIAELIYDYSEDLVAWGWENITIVESTARRFDGWKTDITTFEEYEAWVNNRNSTTYNFRAESETKQRYDDTNLSWRFVMCDVEDVWTGANLIVISGKDEATGHTEVSAKREPQQYDVFFDEKRPWDDKAYHGAPFDMFPASACGEGEKPDRMMIMYMDWQYTAYAVWKQY